MDSKGPELYSTIDQNKYSMVAGRGMPLIGENPRGNQNPPPQLPGNPIANQIYNPNQGFMKPMPMNPGPGVMPSADRLPEPQRAQPRSIPEPANMPFANNIPRPGMPGPGNLPPGHMQPPPNNPNIYMPQPGVPPNPNNLPPGRMPVPLSNPPSTNNIPNNPAPLSNPTTAANNMLLGYMQVPLSNLPQPGNNTGNLLPMPLPGTPTGNLLPMPLPGNPTGNLLPMPLPGNPTGNFLPMPLPGNPTGNFLPMPKPGNPTGNLPFPTSFPPPGPLPLPGSVPPRNSQSISNFPVPPNIQPFTNFPGGLPNPSGPAKLPFSSMLPGPPAFPPPTPSNFPPGGSRPGLNPNISISSSEPSISIHQQGPNMMIANKVGMDSNKLSQNYNNGNLMKIQQGFPDTSITYNHAGPGQDFLHVVGPPLSAHMASAHIRQLDPDSDSTWSSNIRISVVC